MDTIAGTFTTVRNFELSHLPNLISTNLPLFLRGLFRGCSGLFRNCKSDAAVHRIYTQFIKEGLLPVLILIYTVLGTVAVTFFPVTIAMLVLMPGLVWQLLTILPSWSLSIARRRHPIGHKRLFIEALRPLDPVLAERLNAEMQARNHVSSSWIEAILASLNQHVWFWMGSLACLSFSLIPLIGGLITALLQTFLVSRKLAWSVMEQYMTDVRHLGHQGRINFMNSHWALMFGFCLSYIILSSIPFVGALSLALAQASAADLYYFELLKEEAPKPSVSVLHSPMHS